MNRDLYAELFSNADTETEILDIAADILTETIELLFNLGLTGEVLKAYVDLVEQENAS